MRTIWSTLQLPVLLFGAGTIAVEPSAGPISNIQAVRNGHYPVDVVDKLRDDTMTKVEAWMTKKSAASKNGCTLENVGVRREWSDLSVRQREEYVAAVQCLMKLPAQAPKQRYPGALSRFDDFSAYHITHAGSLHGPFTLFGAHKYFIETYEHALRAECNYTGYQPYMNYDRYSKDPINSPLFNGNSSSMGGNGQYDPSYKGVAQNSRSPNLIKSGGGGGCVTKGPFSDMVVSLGPSNMRRLEGVPKNPRPDGTGSNPRCLRRDINKNAAMGATADRAYDLITRSKDIDAFYNGILGNGPPYKNDLYPWGIHTAGHYIYGVDPGGDPAQSPGDPLFFFHHSSLDRLWWIWQMQDPETRMNALPSKKAAKPSAPGASHSHRRSEGLTSAVAEDPSEATTDLEWLAPKIKVLETHDALGGNGGMRD